MVTTYDPLETSQSTQCCTFDALLTEPDEPKARVVPPRRIVGVGVAWACLGKKKSYRPRTLAQRAATKEELPSVPVCTAVLAVVSLIQLATAPGIRLATAAT